MIVIQRKGFALAAALLALLMIAGLVAGVFFAANEGTRMVVASAQRQVALAAAESAIEAFIVGRTDASEIGAVGVTSSTTGGGGGVPVRVYATRLDTTLVWVVAESGPARPGSGVVVRIGALMRLNRVAGDTASVARIPERWWSELF